MKKGYVLSRRSGGRKRKLSRTVTWSDLVAKKTPETEEAEEADVPEDTPETGEAEEADEPEDEREHMFTNDEEELLRAHMREYGRTSP